MSRILISIGVILFSVGVSYFSGVGFGFSVFEQLLVGVLALALYTAAARRGTAQLALVLCASIATAASLGCAFLRSVVATGPLVVPLTFSPWVIVMCAVAAAGVSWFVFERMRSNDWFAGILLALFVLNWVILAFNVRFYDDWKMENWLTVPFVILIYVTHRWFKFSMISYTLIFAYLMLHIYGSHYTYSEVPLGFWMQDVFDMARNHYDRIVHLSFGLLLAYPIREMIVRISNTRGVWGYWFPVEFVLAFSCIYELLEWWIAVAFGGDLGIAYLGTQGDVWDAQKDMFLAGMGSLIAMLLALCIAWFYRKGDLWHEMRESLRVKHRKALGEEALRDWSRS